MRQIEQSMRAAIKARKNFSRSNTAVVFNAKKTLARVYLHGNLIAVVDPVTMGLKAASNCGWYSVTTKSRLNALGACITQKNFEWYGADGKPWHNDNCYAVFK